MNRTTALLSCLIAVLVPTTGFADWFALELGTVRRYESLLDGDTTVSSTTTVESIRNREVYRIENEVTGGNPQVYWNYWSVDGEGRLLLHGFRIGPDPEAFFAHYEPPLVYADASPVEGATWSTTFEVWNSDEGPPGGLATYSGQSYGLEVLDLAVGSFEALLTGSSPDEPVLRIMGGETGAGYSLTGRRVPVKAAARAVEAQDMSWWVQGIGEVQYSFTPLNLIRSLTFASVSIEEGPSTASRLKSKFLPRN